MAGGFAGAARQNASLVRRIVLIGGTAFGLGILGAAHAHDATRALIWISISIGGLAAAAPVAWSLPSLIARRNDVGKVGGIINFSNQSPASPRPSSPDTWCGIPHLRLGLWRLGRIWSLESRGYIFMLGKHRPPKATIRLIQPIITDIPCPILAPFSWRKGGKSQRNLGPDR